ncbi:MAG: hypothetical protein F6J92_34200 [Symploca sp. SIO1A3]|nr:hypothetical protein [Symploca sp. SIO1A3]
MSNSTTLRLLYQCELGNKKVCDRTWKRVKNRLGLHSIDENVPDIEIVELVKAYAFLRRLYPNRPIAKAKVEQYLTIRNNLPNFHSCSGQELYEIFQRLEPCPSDATIYRWGEQIGCKFGKYKIYNTEQINRWVEFLARNPNFKFPYNRLKKVG